jgi:Mg-chelatase subunit ChlD
MRHRHHDSSIGWISFSDTLFFGFGLLLLFGMRLTADLKSSTSRVTELEQAIAEGRSRPVNHLAPDSRLDVARRQLTEQEKQLAGLNEKIAELEASKKATDVAFAARTRQEKRVRHELLGLKGKMSRVAVILDSSQSMERGNRWVLARTLVQEWIECLDMDSCVVIVYHNKVFRRPAQGVFNFTTEREASVSQIHDFLAERKPGGKTDTLQALEMAYLIPNLDTVILFTDGSPNVDDKPGSDKEQIEKIYTLCRAHPDIPINAIGIGDYFARDLSTFLLKVAEITHGTFIGR